MATTRSAPRSIQFVEIARVDPVAEDHGGQFGAALVGQQAAARQELVADSPHTPRDCSPRPRCPSILARCLAVL